MTTIVADTPRPERRRNWDAKAAKDRLRELERKWRERREQIIRVIREQLRDDRSETNRRGKRLSRKATASHSASQAQQVIVAGINDAASTPKVPPLRIRILHAPSGDDVDGVDLSHFHVGCEYDMSHPFAEMMVAEGWAEPIAVDAPQPPTVFGPDDPFTMPVLDRSTPPKLVKEQLPTYLIRDKAADMGRRRRKQR